MDLANLSELIPFAFFVAAVIITWIVFKYITKEKKSRYDLIAKAIENGQPIPENLLAPQEKPKEKSFDHFKNASLFLMVALASWAVFIYQKCSNSGNRLDFPLIFMSAFLTAFGVAFLIIGFLRRAEEKRENTGK